MLFRSKSYGIHVAKLAGLPNDVTQHAAQVLSVLEAEGSDLVNDLPTPEQLPLFRIAEEPKPKSESKQTIQAEAMPPEVSALLAEIKNTNLMQATPIEAMNLINQWQQELNQQNH